MSQASRLFLLLLLTACVSAPVDPFVPVAGEVDRGHFLRALVLLDQVAPAHPKYAEARTLAQALERRMRVSEELVLRGLRLRSEWRDHDAVECFQKALVVWPDVAVASELVEATRHRIAALSSGAQTQILPEARTIAANQSPEAMPATPGAEVAPSARARLGELDALLARGELEAALDLLATLVADYPDDPDLKSRFARALHQRALLRYGQAFLEAAITDWVRVVQLDPSNAQAREFVMAARAELEERRRR